MFLAFLDFSKAVLGFKRLVRAQGRDFCSSGALLRWPDIPELKAWSLKLLLRAMHRRWAAFKDWHFEQNLKKAST